MLHRVAMLAFLAATFFTQSSSAQHRTRCATICRSPIARRATGASSRPASRGRRSPPSSPRPTGRSTSIHRCFENSCAGRKEAPILKYDANGKLLKAAGAQGMFIFPHGATVDRDGNLWVTDARGENGKGHQVFKFSPDGKVLMTLGKAGVSGSGADLFDQPTDVVVAPDGDDLRHRQPPQRQEQPRGEADEGRQVHQGVGHEGIRARPDQRAAHDRDGLAGTRCSSAIARTTASRSSIRTGKFIAEWRQFGRPSGISITRDDTIYVTDSESGPDTGARELPGIKKGIRIGSAKTGVVTRVHRGHGIDGRRSLGRRRRRRRCAGQRLRRRRAPPHARTPRQEIT